MVVHIHRIYEGPGPAGYRVLVDRLWPRGVKKADAHLDEWLQDAAPSTALRRWYGHEVARFDEFARRYHIELDAGAGAEAVEHLADVGRDGDVVLVTATRDVAHSGAQVLADHLRDGS